MASAFPRNRITPVTTASSGLTIATTAYSSGDVLGAQMQFRVGDGFGPAFGHVSEMVVVDKAALLTTVELWLFSTAVTPAADNAALSFSDADIASLVAVIPASVAYSTALNKVVMSNMAEPRPVFTGAGGILYGTLVTRAGHTFFGAATDVTVVMHYEPEF